MQSHLSPDPPDPTVTGHLDSTLSQLPVGEATAFLSGQYAHLATKDNGKRRRIARACDMCRKKKIKCDGKLPACTHCESSHAKCVFTFVEKKRSPPKGAKYIEGLENRLGRMESLLKLSGILPETDDGKMDLGAIEKELSSKRRKSTVGNSHERERNPSTGVMYETPESSASSRGTSPEAEKDDEGSEAISILSDMMCSLVTNAAGESRYIGSSSGFSIFSPRGIQWVNSKTGDHSFQEMLQNVTRGDYKWAHWKSDVFDPLFTRHVENAIPPYSEAKVYVVDFFQYFNVMFPLFHQQTIEALFEQYYSRSFNATRSIQCESGWWAAMNMILAIGCRVRGAQNPNADEEAKGWAFFQNAASVLTELMLKNTNLLSIQAMLAMALFLQGTANPQPSYFLVAAAIRVANSIGLHRRSSSFGFNEIERLQRLRCFWIAYMLDKDIAIRSGRPPAINDDDINVELPEEGSPDGLGTIALAGGRGSVNLFRLMCRFSQISSKVYMQIYSAKAARQSDGELLSTIAQLDNELEQWRDSVPIDFRPEYDISDEYKNMLSVIVLHFAYYNCLATIHRMSVQQGYWTSRLSNYAISGALPVNARIYSSASICVSAARASVHLIKHVKDRDNPCAWMVLYYPVSALVTLFANILQNPNESKASSDLQLMHCVVDFLKSLQKKDDDEGNVDKLLYIAAEFDRIARLVLEKSHRRNRQNVARKKRRLDENENESNDHPEEAAIPQDGVPYNGIAVGVSSEGSQVSTFPENRSGMEISSPSTISCSTNPAVENSDKMDESTSFLSPQTIESQEPFVPQSLWNLEWDWTELGLGIHGQQYQNGPPT